MKSRTNPLKQLAIASVSAMALFSTMQADAANIAILTGSFYTSNLNAQLTALGNTVTEISSYTTGSFAGFDSVITYGNQDNYDFAALEDFASSGGTVVETPWFWLNQSPTAGLDIFTHGGTPSPNTLGLGLNYAEINPGVDVLDAGNHLLNGVSFPAAGTTPIARTIGNSFVAGVTQVANWDDGTAFIGEKTLGAGRVIGINLHVITSDTPYFVIDEQWAATLLCNAACIPATPAPVPVPAAVWLMGSGIAGVVGALRRKKEALAA